MLTAYVAEMDEYWFSEAWDYWKVWWVPPATLGSIQKLDFRSCLGEEGLLELTRLLVVLNGVDWTEVLLLQCRRTSYGDISSPGHTYHHGNFV